MIETLVRGSRSVPNGFTSEHDCFTHVRSMRPAALLGGTVLAFFAGLVLVGINQLQDDAEPIGGPAGTLFSVLPSIQVIFGAALLVLFVGGVFIGLTRSGGR